MITAGKLMPRCMVQLETVIGVNRYRIQIVQMKLWKCKSFLVFANIHFYIDIFLVAYVDRENIVSIKESRPGVETLSEKK